MIDEDLLKKLRAKQAKLLKSSNNSISLSRVINECLLAGLKNGKA